MQFHVSVIRFFLLTGTILMHEEETWGLTSLVMQIEVMMYAALNKFLEHSITVLLDTILPRIKLLKYGKCRYCLQYRICTAVLIQNWWDMHSSTEKSDITIECPTDFYEDAKNQSVCLEVIRRLSGWCNHHNQWWICVIQRYSIVHFYFW